MKRFKCEIDFGKSDERCCVDAIVCYDESQVQADALCAILKQYYIGFVYDVATDKRTLSISKISDKDDNCT